MTGELIWLARPAEMFEATPAWSSVAGMRKWNTRYAGKPALTGIDGEGYRAGAIFHRKHRAHRIIWKMMTGETPRKVDHINGIRSDNRFSNLRAVDDVLNARNSAAPSTNTSGRVGVRFNPGMGRWVAYITSERRMMHLGSFLSMQEAVAAREAAERRLGYHPNHGRRAA